MTILRRLALATALIAGLTATLPQIGAAQAPNCADRDKILTQLARGFEERPVGRGVTATGALMEVLSGPSGSWTVLITMPGGATCVVAHGDGWHEPKPAPVEPLV